MMRLFYFSLLFFISLSSFAKLKVVTTTTNLMSIVEELGGDRVTVSSLCQGAQDPHFLQAKPSFMLDVSKADLLIAVGLELESAWLPLIVRGARNPSLRPGSSGYLELGTFITPIEQVKGEITRADGDVHPSGNPHFMLDPLMVKKVAGEVTKKLLSLSKENKDYFLDRYKSFIKKLNAKHFEVKEALKSKHNVITYHRTLSYFYKRYGISNIAYLEPKPGVPPTAKHILDVVAKAKDKKLSAVLVENYFDLGIAKKMGDRLGGISIVSIPVAVNGRKDVQDLFELYDIFVKAIKGDK